MYFQMSCNNTDLKRGWLKWWITLFMHIFIYADMCIVKVDIDTNVRCKSEINKRKWSKLWKKIDRHTFFHHYFQIPCKRDWSSLVFQEDKKEKTGRRSCPGKHVKHIKHIRILRNITMTGQEWFLLRLALFIDQTNCCITHNT